jgi:hypothetical protein
LRLTVSQSVCLDVEPHLELITTYLLLFDSYCLVFVIWLNCPYLMPNISLFGRMLNDEEKESLKEILILMWEKDLQLLAQSITGIMIEPLTTQEAMNAILLHSATPESLLQRKSQSQSYVLTVYNIGTDCTQNTTSLLRCDCFYETYLFAELLLSNGCYVVAYFAVFA